jgi:lipopolysaccharide/colanic/teichoic acid biosynthesis glycosyltransferase
MTGWAQVNGLWGDTSIETRVRLDNRYIENWSLWRDLVIGIRTFPTILGKHR